MRELSTDRPDRTESPYTVDAGHFQVELDAFSFSYDKHNPSKDSTRVESLTIAPVNLKVGLCNHTDFQLIIEPYVSVRTDDRSTGTVTKNRGFGDITARLKYNFWGNDGGTTAFGVMPFVKFPTNQDGVGNDAFEGGIIFPLGVSLPADVSMGLMTEFDFIEDGDGSGYHPEFINTITFSRNLIGNLGGYVEFFSAVSTESGSDWVGTFDFGFTYAVTEDIQLDAGVNIGVTRAAEDYNPFLGISWRF